MFERVSSISYEKDQDGGGGLIIRDTDIGGHQQVSLWLKKLPEIP